MPESMRSPHFEALPPREQMVLAFALKAGSNMTSVDLGQSVERAPVGLNGRLSTLTPGSKTWLVNQKRAAHAKTMCSLLHCIFDLQRFIFMVCRGPTRGQ